MMRHSTFPGIKRVCMKRHQGLLCLKMTELKRDLLLLYKKVSLFGMKLKCVMILPPLYVTIKKLVLIHVKYHTIWNSANSAIMGFQIAA